MPLFGDFYKEFKEMPPKEKLLVAGGAIAVVAIILYVHGKQGQTPVTLPGQSQGGGGGGGTTTSPSGTTSTGTNPVTTAPTSTPRSPTQPPAGNKPAPRPTYPVRPIKGNPIKQPTTVTKTVSRGTLRGTPARPTNLPPARSGPGPGGTYGKTRGNAGDQPPSQTTGTQTVAPGQTTIGGRRYY